MKYGIADISIFIMAFMKVSFLISPEDLYWALAEVEEKSLVVDNQLKTVGNNYKHNQRKRIHTIFDYISDEYTCELWIADFNSLLHDDIDIFNVEYDNYPFINLIDYEYQIIYQNDKQEKYDIKDQKIRFGCIRVFLKFKILNNVRQKKISLRIQTRNLKNHNIQFNIIWKDQYARFRFLMNDQGSVYFQTENLEIDGKQILFISNKMFPENAKTNKICDYVISKTPLLAINKETGHVIELTLDNLKYCDFHGYNLDDMLSISKQNELREKNKTIRTFFECETYEGASILR